MIFTVQSQMAFHHSAPVIRIAAIELRHFKSVDNGKAYFLSAGPEEPTGTQADILAVYGQNGSGKTALIQAVALLRLLLTASPVPAAFADCIDVAAERAELTYTLLLQYPEGIGREAEAGDRRTVFYTVQLARSNGAENSRPGVRICGERLQAEGTFSGKPLALQTLLDATGPVPGPQSMVREILGGDISLPDDWDSHTSLFFASLFHNTRSSDLYWKMLIDLYNYGLLYLVTVDTAADGIVRQNQSLPIYTNSLEKMVPMNDDFPADAREKSSIEAYLASVSRVMEAVVPGLQVQLRDLGPVKDEQGNTKRRLSLVSVRGERELPLRCESDGVRHLLSVLWTLTWAYNDAYVTLAVDELDAGVFEFLLGELLQVFREGGRGQLLFTAHNLRPLEVLDSESILFTTTDPADRYRKLTGIDDGENLRRAYYREILLHEHFDDLYAPTKRYRIAMAMASAAGDDPDADAEDSLGTEGR